MATQECKSCVIKKFIQFPHKYYETGISEIDTKSGLIKIFDREKTICDLFRYINKIGEDIAIETLKRISKKSQIKKYPETV
ncbi:MAG: hypothetical protein ACYC6P_11940 [Ignavibacteriaceae bacterium]